MTKPLDILTQDELFTVLRNILKTTQNELLPDLLELKRVQALFNAIEPTTWKAACEKHFSVVLEGEKETDPRAVYLEQYPNNRFGV